MWASSAADVGKIIVAARRYRGLTQTELADAIGATQSWVSEVEGKGYGSNRESTRNLELSRRSPKHLHHTVERAQIRKTLSHGVSLSGILDAHVRPNRSGNKR
jgi:transcriptional regulator with XRE-family HTH domain